MSKLDSFVEELKKAERTLARRDKKLGAFIKRYGACSIRPHTRYFHTLVGSIISQQLSTKAADTIHKRFLALYAPTRSPRPEQILATPDEDLRGTGISYPKVSYIKDIAAKTEDGTLKFNRLSKMSDDEIIKMLTTVKGIGVWTVHMFLIFSLGRMDVLPVGDLGIREAFNWLTVLTNCRTLNRSKKWLMKTAGDPTVQSLRGICGAVWKTRPTKFVF